MFEAASRMHGLSSAIFSQVDELRKEQIRLGKDVITLSIGSPDLPPAPHIVNTLLAEAANGSNYGYTLSKGIPEFLHAVTDWYATKFGVVLDPEHEVHSLIGSQEGLAHLSLCLINPGDVVLIPDPGYPIYCAGPLMADPEFYFMPLHRDRGFLPDFQAVPENILQRAKLMILNYPNNPLAATATADFFAEAVAVAQKHNILICHDFAYSELVFDGYKPPSILEIPGARDVAIEFHSLSKTYNMAGCRIGFVVGNRGVIALLGKLKSNFDYGVFRPIQLAAVSALNGPQDCVRELTETYQRRRDIVVNGLTDLGWKIQRPKGTMYIWAPIPAPYTSSFQFTVDLLCNTGVAVIPGVAFGPCGEGYVRFALVQPEDRLHDAISRIKAWLANASS